MIGLTGEFSEVWQGKELGEERWHLPTLEGLNVEEREARRCDRVGKGQGRKGIFTTEDTENTGRGWSREFTTHASTYYYVCQVKVKYSL